MIFVGSIGSDFPPESLPLSAFEISSHRFEKSSVWSSKLASGCSGCSPPATVLHFPPLDLPRVTAPRARLSLLECSRKIPGRTVGYGRICLFLPRKLAKSLEYG